MSTATTTTLELDLHPLFTGKITLAEIQQLAKSGFVPSSPTRSLSTQMNNHFRDHRFPTAIKVKLILQQMFSEPLTSATSTSSKFSTTPSYLPKELIGLVVDGYFDDGKIETKYNLCSRTGTTERSKRRSHLSRIVND